MTLVATAAKASASGGPTVILDSLLGADSAAAFDTGAGGITSSYRRVDILLRSRSSQAAAATDGIRLTLNNDTGNKYAWSGYNTQGSTMSQFGQTTAGGPGTPYSTAASTAPAGAFGWLEIILLGPGDAFAHHMGASFGYFNASGSNFQSGNITQLFTDAAAITRAALSLPSGANWIAGSRCLILGFT